MRLILRITLNLDESLMKEVLLLFHFIVEKMESQRR